MRIDEKKLRIKLIEQERTQKELSADSGVSRPTINAICCGRACSKETAEKLAAALGVPLEELMK